ncbi:flagellar filament capping protein FliD [Candidatus Hydrogenedentota bacterium]
MGNLFSMGGLASGLDSNALITQLMAFERRPIFRIEDQIKALEQQQTAIKDIRSELITLYNRTRDFSSFSVFDKSSSTSSDETIVTTEATGSGTRGAYEITTTQLATSTRAESDDFVAKLTGTIGVSMLDSLGMGMDPTSGTFTVNGVEFTIDVTADTLQDVIDGINADPDVGVDASYNAASEKLVLTNRTANADVINLGASSDTSNFLDATFLIGTTQTGATTTVSSSTNLGSIHDAGTTLDSISTNGPGGTISIGTFKVNGVEITITDTSTDTLASVISDINSAETGVTASFDSASNTLRMVSDGLGSRSISFEAGTSNFLAEMNIETVAAQTVGQDSQFTVNGTAYTRNSNTVNDVIGGVSFTLLQGTAADPATATLTVDVNYDEIIEKVTDFKDAYNDALQELDESVRTGNALESDNSMRLIMNFMQQTIFNQPGGATGPFSSLVDFGISTGDNFDSSTLSKLEVDENELRTALEDNLQDVKNIFYNDAGDGIADQFADYLSEMTSFTGFLQERASDSGSISERISSLRDRITRLEDRMVQKETRLRRKFTQMEVAMSSYQSTGNFLQAQMSRLL